MSTLDPFLPFSEFDLKQTFSVIWPASLRACLSGSGIPALVGMAMRQAAQACLRFANACRNVDANHGDLSAA
jgi:hypothetical protein